MVEIIYEDTVERLQFFAFQGNAKTNSIALVARFDSKAPIGVSSVWCCTVHDLWAQVLFTRADSADHAWVRLHMPCATGTGDDTSLRLTIRLEKLAEK